MSAHTYPEDFVKANDRFGSVDDGNALTFSGAHTFSGDCTHSGDETFSGSTTFSGALSAAALTLTQLNYPTAAVTATADGTGTGTIADAGMLQFVTVDADSDANHIFILPTPTPGTIVIAAVGATGCEMRSSAPATVGINGGTGASVESAIGANTLVIAICESATSWKAFGIASDGTTAGVEVAA